MMLDLGPQTDPDEKPGMWKHLQFEYPPYWHVKGVKLPPFCILSGPILDPVLTDTNPERVQNRVQNGGPSHRAYVRKIL